MVPTQFAKIQKLARQNMQSEIRRIIVLKIKPLELPVFLLAILLS